MKSILLIDNNQKLLDRYKKLLEKQSEAGKQLYCVTTARSVNEARDILANETNFFDLAIVDIRLENDRRESDETGLYLAREIAESNIPTLIFTIAQKYEFVRRAQNWFLDGLPSHMNFVGKPESIAQFLKAVRGSLRSDNIFIVHGHDGETRNSIELFIRQIELEPIILEDKPSGGRTIIQQLENYSGVAHVLVLLTPDDICECDTAEGRARQNVIFELGYFIGKYGRPKVSAMVIGDVELPSDIGGLIYIPVTDESRWREKLVRELKLSGLRVNFPA